MARILIVDDDAPSRDVLDKMLTHRGHTIVGSALDGTSGKKLALQLLPDIIITDRKMKKEMSGPDMIEALINEGIPERTGFILVSSEEANTPSLKELADDHRLEVFIKPLNYTYVEKAIKRLLART